MKKKQNKTLTSGCVVQHIAPFKLLSIDKYVYSLLFSLWLYYIAKYNASCHSEIILVELCNWVINMPHTENSNDMIPFKRLTTTWNYKCSLNEHSIHFTIRHLVRNTSEAHVLEISTMSKRHPEADHDSFLTKYGCESLHVAQRWEKHFGSKKPPNGITPPPPPPHANSEGTAVWFTYSN